jgi:hypothetical protein
MTIRKDSGLQSLLPALLIAAAPVLNGPVSHASDWPTYQ